MSSQRFPGKMLQPLGRRPLVLFVLQRCQRMPGVETVILATSTESSDDTLTRVAVEAGFPVFRGSLENVLERYIACAERYEAETVVRVCGDSPFVDTHLAGRLTRALVENGLDFVTIEKSRCIAGLDSEAMSVSALRRALALSRQPEDYEHVTFRIRRRPADFLCRFLDLDLDPFGGQVKLTVDLFEDWVLCTRLANALLPTHPLLDFTSEHLFEALKQMDPRRMDGHASPRISKTH